MPRSSDTEDLGPCCVCRKSGRSVRNLITLHKRAPTPGTGWGCMACGLPMDGAIAVVCDGCLGKEILEVCDGYPLSGMRASVASLKGTFEHDMRFHAEESPV